MRKPVYSLFALVVSLLMLTGCNKESSSNLLALLGLGGGGTGTFMKQFGVTLSSNDTYPFSGLNDSKTQYLYTAAEIGASGMITKIRLRQTNVTSAVVTCPNFTIKMGHTSLAALTTTFANNVETGQGSEQTVLDNKTVTIPAAAAESWIDIPLDTPFNYNGVDNLVVDIERTTKCSAFVSTSHFTSANRRAFCNGADIVAGTAEYNATPPISVDSSQPWMQFVFAGGDNTVVCSDKTDDNANDVAPGYTGRTQMLVMASDIKGKGLITGLAIKPDETTGVATVGAMTVRIALLPATTTSLSATFADNYGESTPSVVTQDIGYSVPEGHDSAVWIPFNMKNITYDGESNLLIDISCTVTGGYAVDYKNVDTIRVVTGSEPDATTGTTRSRVFEPVLRFKGGTANVITSGSYLYGLPFYDMSGSQVQTMYRPCEVGLSSTVTSLGFRLKNDSVAETYNNFSIVVGHTDNNILGSGDTFASNMDDAVTVYSGTATVHAGLKAGDWVDFMLTTPFVSNPAKNLVVYMKSDQGTTSQLNNLFGKGDATLYNSRSSYRLDSITTTPETVTDSIMDIRLGTE